MNNEGGWNSDGNGILEGALYFTVSILLFKALKNSHPSNVSSH